MCSLFLFHVMRFSIGFSSSHWLHDVRRPFEPMDYIRTRGTQPHGKHPNSANRRLVNLTYSPNEQHSQCKDLPPAAPFTSKMLGNSSTDSYNCQPRAKLIDDYGEFIIIILTYGFTFFAGFIGEYSLSRRMARFNLLSSLLICFRFWR